MADSPEIDAGLAATANDRYWSSDASVNQIADELGLSKSSLYGLIRQKATGLGCPECASELVFANRTARDRGLMTCPSCEFVGEGDGLDPFSASPEELTHSQPPSAGGGGRSSTRAMAGAALLGLAAGILIGSATRR